MARRQKYQRRDRRYMVRFDIGTDADGKRLRKCFYGDSAEEARAKRDAWIGEHSPAAVADLSVPTFREWGERWLGAYSAGLAYKTKSNNRSALNAICSTDLKEQDGKFGELKLAEISSVTIQELMSGLDGRSKSKIHAATLVLSNVFKTALDNGLIRKSPYVNIKPPKGTYTGHRCISLDERKVIADNWSIARAGLWAMIMLYAGLRRGEVVALEWGDVDMEERLIHVGKSAYFANNRPVEKSTKTAAGERDIPILPPLFAALDTIPAERRTGHVCKGDGGEQLTEAALKRGWENLMLVCERAANDIRPYAKTIGWRKDKARAEEGHIVFGCTPHDLRYTFATMLYDADVDVKTAQYLLGHTDLMTTMKIYTKLSDEKKKSSVNKLLDAYKDKF